METFTTGRSGAEVVVDLHHRESPPGERGAVVVYLHGGGWASGSRRDHPRRLSGLASRGVTVASIDYRTVATAAWPAQRDDVSAVLAALPRHLEDPPGDVVLMGASAGAHLAAMVAFSDVVACAGLVGLFGRYDLTREADALAPASGVAVPAEILRTPFPPGLSHHQHRVAALVGGSGTSRRDEELAAVSPLHVLAAGAPPLFLAHGTGDALVSHRHSERLALRARHLGVPCELVLVPGANHEDRSFEDAAVLDAIAAFIHRVSSTQEGTTHDRGQRSEGQHGARP